MPSFKNSEDAESSGEPPSYTVQAWPVDLPEADTMLGWSRADIRTLLLTAGEIAVTYGTGTNGLDRDDILSSRQRAILGKAAKWHRKHVGE